MFFFAAHFGNPGISLVTLLFLSYKQHWLLICLVCSTCFWVSNIQLVFVHFLAEKANQFEDVDPKSSFPRHNPSGNDDEQLFVNKGAVKKTWLFVLYSSGFLLSPYSDHIDSWLIREGFHFQDCWSSHLDSPSWPKCFNIWGHRVEAFGGLKSSRSLAFMALVDVLGHPCDLSKSEPCFWPRELYLWDANHPRILKSP